MRILIVTRNLPPLVGGMERLNWHMAAELAKVADVHVIGPEGSAALAPAGVPVQEAPLKPLWKFLLRARSLARREARTWQPDWVLAGSGLTAPLVRSAARCCGARTAVYVHGLDVAVRHLVYRAVWLPAIRRMDRIIANSHATAKLCAGIGVDVAKIGIVHPGVDLPAKLPPPGDTASGGSSGDEPLPLRERGTGEGTESRGPISRREPAMPIATEPSSGPSGHLLPEGEGQPAFRTRHNLANRPLLLSVGRLSARKGLREFVTQAMPEIVSAHPCVLLVIIGGSPKDALLGTAQTPDAIRAVAAQAGVAANVTLLGSVADDALATAYAASSVHVFPVREIPGDPEGFGMVAIEAAAHGLPTVAFATGGVPDAIVEGESGSLVASGDYAAFAAAVNAWLARSDRDVVARRCTTAAGRFSWTRFGTELRAVFGLPLP